MDEHREAFAESQRKTWEIARKAAAKAEGGRDA